MRRFNTLTLTLLLLLTLVGAAACSPASTTNAGAVRSTTAVGGQPAASGTGYAFTVRNQSIHMHDPMTPILTALGQPKGVSETPSCAFQGMDKLYDFGSYIITTYTLDKQEKTLKVDIRDDTVETPEHIAIGSAAAAVKAAYGEPVKTVNESLIYEKGNTRLTFIMKNDAVTSIQYDAILD